MLSYFLKIILRGSPHLIWRRFVMLSDTLLRRLYHAVQNIMGGANFVVQEILEFVLQKNKTKKSAE
jgi:hypothetical protein